MRTISKPAHGSTEWLRARQRDEEGRIRFGGSEASTLMGVNPFANLVDLFIAKHDPNPVQIENEATHRGNVLEGALVAEAGRRFGFEPVVPEVMFIEGRLMTNLDGADDLLDPSVIIEAKTTTAYDTHDDCPESYYWQVIAQFATTNAEMVELICLDKRQRIGGWTFHRDEESEGIERLLLRASEIGDLFDRAELPDEIVPTQQQINRLFPNPTGTRTISDDELAIIQEWRVTQDLADHYDQQATQLRNIVASMIGNYDTIEYGGKTIVTYKSRKNADRLDLPRLRSEHPEIAERYTIAGGTTRVLRYAGGKR